MLNIVHRTLHFTSARNKRKLLISCSYGRTCMKKICGESLTALAWIISVYCHHWMNLHREKSPGCFVTLSLDYSTSLFRLFPIQSLPSQSSNTRSYTNVSGVKCTLLLKRTTMNSAQRNKWPQWKNVCHSNWIDNHSEIFSQFDGLCRDAFPYNRRLDTSKWMKWIH